MIINADILRRDVIKLIKQIDQQIEEVERQAQLSGCEAHQLRDGHGNWPITPLILAKTQAYIALIALQK